MSRLAAISGLGALAILTRAAGIVLVPAMLLHWALRARDPRLSPVALLLAWTITALLMLRTVPTLDVHTAGAPVAVSARGSGRLTTRSRSRAASHWARALAAAATNATCNVGEYRFGVFDTLLYPFPTKRANQAYHAIAILAVSIGLLTWLRGLWRSLLASFALLYAALLLVYPVASGRYLWPLAPLLASGFALGIARGVAAGARRLRPGERAPQPWPARVALAVVEGLACAGLARTLAQRPPPGVLAYPDVRSLFAYARLGAARQRERWVVFNPRVLTLYTAVPAMPRFGADRRAMLDELERRGITHVALGSPMREQQDSGLRRLIAERPTEFTREFANGTFAVYRFDPGYDADSAGVSGPTH